MGSKLFSKLRLRDLELENRIVVSPMCQYSAVDGVMNDWHLMHLGNLSVSGPGLVFVEATGVESRGRITPGCVGLHDDEQEASQKRVLEFCRKHGQAKMGIQLAHAGRKASTMPPWEGGKPLPPENGAWETVGPSPVPFAEGWHVPAEMTLQDLEAVKNEGIALHSPDSISGPKLAGKCSFEASSDALAFGEKQPYVNLWKGDNGWRGAQNRCRGGSHERRRRESW